MIADRTGLHSILLSDNKFLLHLLERGLFIKWLPFCRWYWKIIAKVEIWTGWKSEASRATVNQSGARVSSEMTSSQKIVYSINITIYSINIPYCVDFLWFGNRCQFRPCKTNFFFYEKLNLIEGNWTLTWLTLTILCYVICYIEWYREKIISEWNKQQLLAPSSQTYF